MPPKRRGFYEQAPTDNGLDLLRERNVESLIQPLIQPARTVQRNVPIERIRPNPFQARRTFTGIDELAKAIRAHGFISRLRVRPDPLDAGYFQLVYGERRWRAAKIAGLDEIPCEIAEHSDPELLEIGLLENIQREDLDPLEEARAFRIFIDQHGYTVRSLAERISKSKGYVDNRLALLRAPEDVQQMVAERPDTVASARLIAQVPTAEGRRPLIEGLTKGALAAKDVRDLLRDARTDTEQDGEAGETLSSSSASMRSDPGPEALRALARSKRILDIMMNRLELLVPQLDPVQQDELLRYIVEDYFPRMEQLVEALRGGRPSVPMK
jgi:ParB family chromosome partitioning protein